jgi:hypothetical protein
MGQAAIARQTGDAAIHLRMPLSIVFAIDTPLRRILGLLNEGDDLIAHRTADVLLYESLRDPLVSQVILVPVFLILFDMATELRLGFEFLC